jgi:DNA topoisomerase-1
MLPDTVGAARRAELHYVAPDGPGIRRIRRGKGFAFLLPNGRTLKNAETLARIRRLAIPPAWSDVWICPDETGHLQATGKDARGRTQYRYHPRWREVRDEAKYHDVIAFGRSLPKLRRRVRRDLALRTLSKQKVLATVVRVLERTCIRVGNDRYATSNRSYGLTTLLDRHADVRKGVVEFRFRGKGGKAYRAKIQDARLANIVKHCRDIPGQRLFQYVDDDGEYRPITSTDVNDYLRRATGRRFTAKTFRTWAGTLATAVLLSESDAPHGARGSERAVRRAVARVADELGNTAAVCRKSYVHPAVVSAFRRGELEGIFPRRKRSTTAAYALLSPEERAVLGLLGGRTRRHGTNGKAQHGATGTFRSTSGSRRRRARLGPSSNRNAAANGRRARLSFRRCSRGRRR